MKLTTKILRKLIKEAINEARVTQYFGDKGDDEIAKSQEKKARERDADPEKKAARQKKLDDFFSLGKKEGLDEDSDEPYGGNVDARSAAKWNKPSRRSTGGSGNRPLSLLDRWQSMKSLLSMAPGMAIGMSTPQFKKYQELAANEPDIADALAKGQIYDNGMGQQREE
jgi:hypothetical protein